MSAPILRLNPATAAAMRSQIHQAMESGKPSPWLANPAGWCANIAGDHLWSTQKRICRSLVNHTRTAVQSCHGIGKSFISARLALWWIDAHPPGTAIVVTSAPTYAQVHAILWEEIRKGHRAAGLAGQVLKSDEWQNDGGDIVGFGRKPRDTDEDGFQGIHRRYVLVILDEACGIPKSLFTGAEAIITNTDSRILAIGNPTDPGTEFGAVCQPGSGWNVIQVSAFDTPNFTGETIPDELSAVLISPQWVDDKRRRWGEDSPLWKARVLGQFPDVSENTLIHPAWIQAAQDRELTPAGENTLGVDVARFGPDSTIIAHRRGPHARIVDTMGYSATTTTAGHVSAYQTAHEYPVANVDGVGIGGGVVDILAENGLPVADMQSGAAPVDGTRFKNARAEWYWHLRDLFQDGRIDIDPADDELANQLLQIRYDIDSHGRITIESKQDMQARGVSSPDRADALMLAFAASTTTHHHPVVLGRW